MLLQSDMEEIEHLCNTNKEIRSYCEDKNLWKILMKEKQIILFDDINQIQTFSEFIRAYKKYQYYETQALKIIDFSIKNNNYIYVDLNIDDDEKTELVDYLGRMTNNWPEYGIDPRIPIKIIEINFDFKNNIVVYVFEGNIADPFQMASEKLFNILLDILYYYDVDLKMGFPMGGMLVPGSNIRLGNKSVNDLSVIKKNLQKLYNNTYNPAYLLLIKNMLNQLS